MKFKESIVCISLATSLIAQEGTIVVQETKLSDTQMNNSSSVEILSKEKIELFKIDNIEDISSTISNTNISGIGNRSDKTFTFRGMSNYIAYESSVAMYIDNIPIPMSYGFGAFDMNNIANIEILKGPQGTLFGKNAQSGVINIFTNPTSNKLKINSSIDVAQYNSKNIYASISGPTQNKDLSYAVSISKNSTDGYSTNTQTNSPFDKRELKSFNTKINYNIDQNKQLTLSYIKTKTDDGGTAFKINTKENPFAIDTEPSNDSTKMDNDLASIQYTSQNDNYKFTSTTTHAKQDIVKNDYVGILGGLIMDFDIELEEFTQEFRLKYEDDKFEYLVGAFYSDKFKFDYKENQKLKAFNLNSKNIIENTDSNKALFAQTRYWIQDHYSVSVGARYQEMKREFSRDLTEFSTVQREGKDTKTWRYISPTLSFLYYKQNNDNIYATYTQGYRPGGYNYRETGDNLVPYKQEQTDSLELGYKSNQKQYSFESSVFYNKIKDLRINTLDDNLATTTLNAQKAYSYGLEFKSSFKKKNLNIYSTLGFIKAKIKQFDSNPNQEDKNIIDVPQMTASIGSKYNLSNKYHLQATLNHVGKKYYDISNNDSLNSSTIYNIGMGYKEKNFKVLLYTNNLFDKRYSDFMISTPSNKYYHFAKPRVVGAKISYKF